MFFFILSLENPVCVSHVWHISVHTSHSASALRPCVACGCCAGQGEPRAGDARVNAAAACGRGEPLSQAFTFQADICFHSLLALNGQGKGSTLPGVGATWAVLALGFAAFSPSCWPAMDALARRSQRFHRHTGLGREDRRQRNVWNFSLRKQKACLALVSPTHLPQQKGPLAQESEE